jgi:hypothetical protein
MSRSRLNSSSRIQYDEEKSFTSFAQGKLNTSSVSQKQNAEKNGVDIHTQRKMDSKLKWFTSQISELPGPKTEVIQKIGQQYKQQQA